MNSSFKLSRCRSAPLIGLIWLVTVIIGVPAVAAEVSFVRSIGNGGKIKQFREISGLALGPGDTVIVADGDSGQLVTFSGSSVKPLVLSGKGKIGRAHV